MRKSQIIILLSDFIFNWYVNSRFIIIVIIIIFIPYTSSKTKK